METQNSAPEATNVSEPTAQSDFETEQIGSSPANVSEPGTADSIAVAPKPSYVKLAMRNMVRKRGVSLKHFALTTIGLLTVLIGLSYLTR